jgi:excisionase family DNA binding protein
MQGKKKAIPESSERELYGVEEFSRRLGISIWTARNWAYRGRVSSVKLGSRLLIPASEVSRLIAEGLRPRVEHVS